MRSVRLVRLPGVFFTIFTQPGIPSMTLIAVLYETLRKSQTSAGP
jgi:hypothetical protein